MRSVDDNAPNSAGEVLQPDSRLVPECLNGNQEAWSALIDKYKNLIYSIPVKSGLSSDAEEIFQRVCVTLLSELSKLRDPQALPAWLIRVTPHECFHQRREQEHFAPSHGEDPEEHPVPGAEHLPVEQIHELELEQALREAVASLTPRCRLLIRMLFYESPARPYDEVASILCLAKGSIGFIRGRCLEQLRKNLERAGFAES